MKPELATDGRLRGVTFQGGTIPVGRYADFTMLATPFQTGTVLWKVLQTYQDGQVKPWTGTPVAEGGTSQETGPGSPGPASQMEIVPAGTVVSGVPAAVATGGGDDDSGAAIWLGRHRDRHLGPRGRGRGPAVVNPSGAAAGGRRGDAMRTERRTRLDPATFQLPVEKMRDGYYSDAYFTFTREVLESDDHHPRVLMQVFQRERSVLGGVDEALAILQALLRPAAAGRRVGGRLGPASRCGRCTTGDEIEPWETVLTIEGDYSLFAHLETLYLGVLARRTLIGAQRARAWSRPRAASRSSTSRRGSTTGRCRPATAGPRTSPAPSASPPTRRPRGGAARASAPSRTA